MRNPHTSTEERERWEAAYRETRRSLFLRRWRIRRLVDAPREGLLVDLGSGDGLNAGILDELGYKRIVAFDYSFELLRESFWLPSVAGDAHRLPFRSEAIATVFIDSVLHHLTDYRRVAQELARVLQPGGRLYYMEPRPSLARRFLDKLTFAPGISRLRFLTARRSSLIEEWDLHYHWLENYEAMEKALEAHRLRRHYRKLGVMGIFVSFEKVRPGDEPAAGSARGGSGGE